MEARKFCWDGQWYRSTLEARWAATMQGCGVRFQYEPASYRIPGGLYVPDFWLPAVQHFLEIKPGTQGISHKLIALQECYGFQGFLLSGFPQRMGNGLANMDVFWGDGRRLGWGMPIATKMLYVFGMDESESAQERLVASVHHAWTAVRQRPHELQSIKSIMTSIKIPWPGINEGGFPDE